MPGGKAANCGTFWHGGPDFLVEVASEGDRTREKLAFYGSIGVREILVIERDPWKLELFRTSGDHLQSVGQIDGNQEMSLTSEVLPLSFRLVVSADRIAIEVRHGDEVWQV